MKKFNLEKYKKLKKSHLIISLFWAILLIGNMVIVSRSQDTLSLIQLIISIVILIIFETIIAYNDGLFLDWLANQTTWKIKNATPETIISLGYVYNKESCLFIKSEKNIDIAIDSQMNIVAFNKQKQKKVIITKYLIKDLCDIGIVEKTQPVYWTGII